MNFIKGILKSKGHFVWVVLFFVLNGYAGFIGYIPFTDIIILFFQYLLLAVIVYFVCSKFFKDKNNAAVYASLFMILFLFFEDLRIFLARWKWIAPISALKFYFPLVFVILAAGFFFFKRIRKPLARVSMLLNAAAITGVFIYAVIVSGKIISLSNKKNSIAAKNSCDTCAKPSVYFIVLDEYFGSKGLKEFFNYDNSWFENKLAEKGFAVISNSNSNYHFTVFSMCSILNMDYLNDIGEQSVYNQYGYYKSILGIRQNEVCKIFEQQGYDIVNYSDADINGHPAGLGYELLFPKKALLTNRTLYYQFRRNLPYFFARYGNSKKLTEQLNQRAIWANEERMKATLDEAGKQHDKPLFNYLHLNMPHVPYVYDSTGKNVMYKWYTNLSQDEKDDMYLSYLVYVNKRMTSFIDSLQKATNNKAVIILMSDHGYRDVLHVTHQMKLAHSNLFAAYNPYGKGGFVRDSITSVNTFRILFNDIFKTSYPMVKDSLVIK